jgi:hypothetical protein
MKVTNIRGSVVVKALEGRGFETRFGERIFSIYVILPAALGSGFTQPLREMSTRNIKKLFLGSKVRRVRRADNFTAICEPIV